MWGVVLVTVHIVAKLTEQNRVHELIRDHCNGVDHYSVQTAVDGLHVAMRTLTREQAQEWYETAERDGVDGVVYEAVW